MATFVHVYTGADGQSVVDEREFEMQSFVDSEGAHGLSTGVFNTPGISFRVYEPGYFLDFHTAPRRQYSITLTGRLKSARPTAPSSTMAPAPCCWLRTSLALATRPELWEQSPASLSSFPYPTEWREPADEGPALTLSEGAIQLTTILI